MNGTSIQDELISLAHAKPVEEVMRWYESIIQGNATTLPLEQRLIMKSAYAGFLYAVGFRELSRQCDVEIASLMNQVDAATSEKLQDAIAARWERKDDPTSPT